MNESRQSYCHKHRVPFFGPPCIFFNYFCLLCIYPVVNKRFSVESWSSCMWICVRNPYTSPRELALEKQRERKRDGRTDGMNVLRLGLKSTSIFSTLFSSLYRSIYSWSYSIPSFCRRVVLADNLGFMTAALQYIDR